MNMGLWESILSIKPIGIVALIDGFLTHNIENLANGDVWFLFEINYQKESHPGNVGWRTKARELIINNGEEFRRCSYYAMARRPESRETFSKPSIFFNHNWYFCEPLYLVEPPTHVKECFLSWFMQ